MPKGLKVGGRTAGTPNKATVEFKEAVNNLINFATPHMVNWLEQIATDDPNKALDHVYKFAQFGYPLLSRAEMKHEGEITINQLLADMDDPHGGRK